MAIPSLEELQLLHNNICQAFSDPKRIQIMYALHEQPRHVTALAEALEMPQPTVSRHLRVLRQRDLVDTERDGPAVIYRVSDVRMIDILDQMRDILRSVLTQQTNLMAAD